MKMKRYIKCVIWMLALVVMLCACGSTTEQNTDAAGTYSLADLYERTDTDNIFKLNMIDTDGCCVKGAYLHSGYILLLMQDLPEQGQADEPTSGKMILFPVNKPDAAVSRDIDHLEDRYTLLAGGTVLALSESGSYILYNSGLEEVHKEDMNCGSFLGASDQGDLWFLTSDSAFALYRDGEQIRTIGAEGMKNGSYVGTSNGKAYFTMYNGYYGWTYAAIDMQDWTCSKSQLLIESYDSRNGLISYHSEDNWYIADIDDPFTVTMFTKPYSDESVWNMDDQYLIGWVENYDNASEASHQDYHVYDMHNGGICEEKSSSELSTHEVSMCDYEQGLILFEAHDENTATQGLYLWDISGMTAKEPAKTYETVDFRMDQQRVDELTQEIYDQYGVTVYYDGEHLKEYSTSYDLLECTDTELIGRALYMLKLCMAEYPDGFFEEVKGENISDIVFCLCDSHIQTDMYAAKDAIGTVDTIGDILRMSLDVHKWSELRRIFLHENTHMMVSRLEEEMPKISDTSYVAYWYDELNSPECPSMQSYTWEQTDENLKGVYDVDPDNAWYIDWYSKCTTNEDEARIMENGIYSASAHYYTSPHIDKKSRFLNAMIREAFPCVKNSQEAVFWEQRTGIVDLYREFPDFVGQH